MKNRNKIVIIGVVLISILILFFLVSKLGNKGTYSATSPSITISCTSNKVAALGEVDCDVVLNTAGKKILGVSANYIKNTQVIYESYSDKNNFETITTTENGFATSYLDGVISNSIIIGTIHISMTNEATPGNSYSIGLSNIELCDDEYNAITLTDNSTYTLTIKSNVATLSSLSLTGCTLSPAFASGTTTYSCTVKYNVTSTTITATATSDDATVTGTGTKSLSAGLNALSIVVTAGDGTTKKTYKVNVTVDTKYVLLKYHVNGGVLAIEHDSRISLSNNYVMLNGEYLINSIAYGDQTGSNGLVNTNNATYLNVEKTGYVAKGGAEWNTKADGTGTSYSQSKVYLASDFCDASNGICEVTLYINWVPNNIEAILDIDDGIINNIDAGTTLATIMSQVQTTNEVVLYDNSGNVKSNSQKLMTGDYITISANNTSTSYYISVLGDTSGDGNVTVTDVTKLYQHYRGTKIIPNSQSYYRKAGDVVSDGNIKLNDIAKLYQYVQKKIDYLN